MNITVVSMTYNDDYKLKEWKENYLIYEKQIKNMIIVDNGSKKEYLIKLKETFPNAIIIKRNINGGCTAAYNDGINYALENTDSEAIAIIANDIKPTLNCLEEMYKYLFSDKELGIVSSAILTKDSDIVDNYGHKVKKFKIEYCNRGEKIGNILIKNKYTDLLSGGFTMAKREFYINSGLQDEKLFMYCDEIDTRIKAIKNGYKMGVISNEYAWHRHINPTFKIKRSSASRYLISRNRVYLARKYFGKCEVLKQSIRGGIIIPSIFFLKYILEKDKSYLEDLKYSYIGTIKGLKNNMNKNKYMEF